jgi:hypothetical protein
MWFKNIIGTPGECKYPSNEWSMRRGMILLPFGAHPKAIQRTIKRLDNAPNKWKNPSGSKSV